MTPRVWAVILAAGPSSRLGQPKQLLAAGDRPLLAQIAAQTCAAPVKGVAVVLGAVAGPCARSLVGLPVTVILNPGWRDGMASSIRVAASFAERAGADGLLLCVCDQPRLTAAHLGRLVAAHAAERELIAASHYGGTLGVPALFPRHLFPTLRALDGAAGAQHVICSQPAVIGVDWPDGALDIDTEADLAALGG